MTSVATGSPRSTATASGRSQTGVFYVVLAVYLVVTFSLSGRYQYSLYPDATSYLSIAQAYARGQFWDAFNGYWSPFYCWLLAPLIAAGVDLLMAPKVLALLIGALTLAGLRRLCRRLGLADGSTSVVLVAALPSLVSWSLTFVTPDFLLVAALTWYLSEAVGWSPALGARAGFAAGALAGVAALSKQYALPFVVSHLALAGLLYYQQHRAPAARATAFRWLIAAYLTLFAVMGPWIAIMSAKYARVTIAAAGQYNWYLPLTGFNVGTRTLAPPPFPGAVSAWVDPTPYAHTAPSRIGSNDSVRVPPWGTTPWRSATPRLHRIVLMLEQFSILALPIVAAAGVLGYARTDYRFLHLGLALGLYLGGYQVMTPWFVERLMWILAILLGVLGALVFERVTAAVPLRPATRLAGAVLLAVSFWALPFVRLAQRLDEGQELRATAQALERGGVRGRLASLNRYADSLRVALLTGSSYYGRIAPRASMETVLSELESCQIDFLLIWAEKNPENSRDLYGELAGRFPDAMGGEPPELSALDVRSLTTRPASGCGTGDER